MSFSVLVTCEHASAAVPDDGSFDAPPEVLASHLGFDRGAKVIAEVVARELGAPLHTGRFTRLYVDLNRREENPDVMVNEIYGVTIEANLRATPEARRARIERVHRPYRDAARRDAVRLADAGGCLHLSVHAFEPAIDEATRTFAAGVLYDPERASEARWAPRLRDLLAARGHDTRLNEPYLGYPEGLTSWLREQLPEDRYVGFEIEASYRVDTLRFAHDLTGAVRALLAG